MKTIPQHVFDQAKVMERTAFSAVPIESAASTGTIHGELARHGRNMHRESLDLILNRLADRGWIKRTTGGSSAGGHFSQFIREKDE